MRDDRECEHLSVEHEWYDNVGWSAFCGDCGAALGSDRDDQDPIAWGRDLTGRRPIAGEIIA